MEGENFKEDLAKFIEKLISLVPPYDDISIKVQGLNSVHEDHRNTMDVTSLFPQVDIQNFSLISKLFGLEMRSGGKIDSSVYGIFKTLRELSGEVYKLLDDDRFRSELSNFIGKEIGNPAKEFVSKTVEAIKEHEEGDKMINILMIIQEKGISTHLSEIKEMLGDKGISVENHELEDVTKMLLYSGIVNEVSPKSFSIPDHFRKHLSDILKKATD